MKLHNETKKHFSCRGKKINRNLISENYLTNLHYYNEQKKMCY